MKPFVAVQVFAEGQRNNGKGILVVHADADALSGFLGQRPDVNVSAKGIAPHQLDGDGAELVRGGGTWMRRMPQFCFQRS